MRAKRAVVPVLALLAAVGACIVAAEPESISTTTASTRVTAKDQAILFYSDLGPDSIDVSTYPSEQRRNYAVFARACARCHGLARSISAPYTSRGWWEFYMSGMRLRGHIVGRPLSREEIKSVLDFLEYDSRVRKVDQAAAFEESVA